MGRISTALKLVYKNLGLPRRGEDYDGEEEVRIHQVLQNTNKTFVHSVQGSFPSLGIFHKKNFFQHFLYILDPIPRHKSTITILGNTIHSSPVTTTSPCTKVPLRGLRLSRVRQLVITHLQVLHSFLSVII